MTLTPNLTTFCLQLHCYCTQSLLFEIVWMYSAVQSIGRMMLLHLVCHHIPDLDIVVRLCMCRKKYLVGRVGVSPASHAIVKIFPCLYQRASSLYQ